MDLSHLTGVRTVVLYIAYMHSAISMMRKSSVHPDLAAFDPTMVGSEAILQVCGSKTTLHP